MTATRKWSVGAALVAVLILVAGYFLLISPKRSEVSDLQAQTESQLDTNSTMQTELAVLEQEYKDLPQKQAELAAIEERLPSSPDLPSYIRELQDIANRTGTTLVSMTPAAPVTVGAGAVPASADSTALTPDTLAAINVDVVVEGRWDGVRQFVNAMESTERYTLVGGLTIAEVEDEEGVPPWLLTGTLNSRIFLVPTTPETTESIPGMEATPAPTPTPAP